MSTKITFENEDGKYVVEVYMDTMNIYDVETLLIQPVLLAAGYQPNSVMNKATDDSWSVQAKDTTTEDEYF